MTKFAGWMHGAIGQADSRGVLEKMLSGPGLDHFHGANYAIRAAADKIAQVDECYLIAPAAPLSVDKLRQYHAVYRQQGGEGLVSQSHPLALVVVDALRQSLLLATDPIGLSHIYYAETNDGIVFGSSADFVIRHPEVSSDISAQSVYDYVYFHHCPSPNTIYQQVKKLEGGQCLIYKDGKISLKRYWLPVFQEQMSGSLQHAGDELQQLLVDAVKSSVGSEDNTGAFLSGGLDSSSVAGTLAKVFPGKAKTFSMGFPVEGYNEIEYANIAVKHFNTRQHEYYVTPEDTVAAVPLIARYYDEPFGNSSALAAYYCARLAKENGVSRMLAGDGGDEIFAGNERYAKQMLFDHYLRLPGFAQSALEAGLSCLPRGLANSKLPFKAKRYIEQAKAAMPDRLQDYNFLHRHDVADIFQADFLARIDSSEPLQLLADCYRRPENASTLNRMLYMDWKTTLHDNDLVKVNRMCEMVGVEVCYPLLDQRIVELSCRIPSADKLKGQKLRWFYKQAMSNFLPERIINKPKHGFGLPFGIWLKDHQPLKELAYDAIHTLKKREYFQPKFLDHAIDMHQSIHAAYYGELIWILMMLELWFDGKGR
ncbi:asparagine synthase C-terminal domain-containing protein [Methylomonas sp. SURF-2]|uniref:asparagine synthase (glutamine-hydrolyzing) n=1 Tax=Methylomonas subterranea TaxID=2952225 RepID=A0ABT1TAZ9_9GAMM|nr:asparagine synthase C-terminal domain-containing protein [Methylomonas sp. SURF-2]MCQ8102640.1 asparagine synthase C-terminal domain-containing protein [Methylomonas sp. SURF-2]